MRAADIMYHIAAATHRPAGLPGTRATTPHPLTLRTPAAPALQDLSACSINFVPPQLSGLSRLSALDLSSNFGNAAAVDGAGTESFRALECLTALTRLGLARCRLRRLPPQLVALVALADLDLQVGEWVRGGAYGWVDGRVGGSASGSVRAWGGAQTGGWERGSLGGWQLRN